MAMEMQTRAHAIEGNRRSYDLLYDLITNRNTLQRRRMVHGIRMHLEQRFRRELDNEADPSFRLTLTEFFDNCNRRDRVGNILQMYCIYVSLLLDANVLLYFLPPPPNPDSDEPDGARVPRMQFTLFRQKYLLPMAKTLRDGKDLGGKTLTVPMFCQEMNGVYTSLSPNDPHRDAAAAAGRNERRVALQPLSDLP